MLDERELKSPRGILVRMPRRALADAVAEEWDAQGERIEPGSMPLTQLVFAAIDGGAHAREERIEFVSAHVETDLCRYRAEEHSELGRIQEATWGPLLRWIEGDFGVSLPAVVGIVVSPAPTAAEAVCAWLRELDDFLLTGLAQAVGLSGSTVIGLALLRNRIGADEAFAAATIDEAWNMARWGRDEEAVSRLERLRVALNGVARFFAALQYD